jgi:hypothetical protein
MSNVRTWIALSALVLLGASITTLVARLAYGRRGSLRLLPKPEASRLVRRARDIGWAACFIWVFLSALVVILVRLEMQMLLWYLGTSSAILVAVAVGLRDPREDEEIEDAMSRDE